MHTKKFDTLNKTLLAFGGRRRDIHDNFDREMAKTTKILEEKREQGLLELGNEQKLLQRAVETVRMELEKQLLR